MNLNIMIDDLMIFGVFLLVGFLLREIFKPLQKLFLPASIIGGVVALIMGQQVLGIITIPATFSQYSGAFIRIIMTALVFGVSMNLDKVRSYADYMMVQESNYGLQMFAGIALGAFFMTIWPGLPVGWGMQGFAAFWGGHGTAAGAGTAFEHVSTAQVAEQILGIGMVLATFGIIVAMVVGMAVANFGIRRGWATFVDKPSKQPAYFIGGVLPPEKRKSLGDSVTTSIGINGLALQLSWILLAMFLGEQLFDLGENFIPFLARVPKMVHGILGGLVLWPILCAVKLDKFVDKKTVNQISGLALELLILGAIATLSLPILVDFLVPLVVFTAIMVVLIISWVLFMAYKTCTDCWFEKAMFIIGQSTGATPTGLALLRTVDPEYQSGTADAHGVFSGVTFFNNFFPVLLPIYLATGNLSVGLFLGFGLFAVSTFIGFFIFGRIKKRKMAQRSR